MASFSFKKRKSFGGAKKKLSLLPHIKFYFLAGEAKNEAPLGPTIAMFQLNAAQVCKDLNESSGDYLPGVTVAVKVYKKGPRAHILKLGVPPLKFLIEVALLSLIPQEELDSFNQNSTGEEQPLFAFPSELPVALFFDTIRAHAVFTNVSVEEATKFVYGTLRSSFPSLIQSIVILIGHYNALSTIEFL